MAVVTRQLPPIGKRLYSRSVKRIRAMGIAVLAGLCGTLSLPSSCNAQQQMTSQWALGSSALNVDPNSSEQQLLEMVVNSSREIVAEQPFRRVRIHNPEIIDALPLEGGNRLQVSARKTGVTQVDLLGADESVASVQVVVIGDIRELESLLRRLFPGSAITLTPTPQGIVIGGYTTNAADLDSINLIASQYFPSRNSLPSIVNRVTVTGAQTIQLQTQIMEVSRTKLRALGIDWTIGDWTGTNGFLLRSSGAGVLQPESGAFGGVGNVLEPSIHTALGVNETAAWGAIVGATKVATQIEALQQNNLVKILANPILVAEDGRVATFTVGGQVPYIAPTGNGNVQVGYNDFGTKVDFFAKSLGNGRIRLEVRAEVSEPDEALSIFVQNAQVPGFRKRVVETGVELNAGQTLAIGGLIQSRTEAVTRGLPGLSEMPYIGSFFRKVKHQENEIELLITVTPDFAAALDPHQVPPSLPGLNSQSPTNHDLYFKGYIEVPMGGPESCPTPPHGLLESHPQGANHPQPMAYPSSAAGPNKPYGVSVGPNAPRLAETPPNYGVR